MTAPVFQSVGTQKTGTGTSAASIAIPASVVAGDLLVLFLTVGVQFAGATAPSGWTQIDGLEPGGGIAHYGFYRLATGSDTAPTISWSGGSGAYIAQIARYTGHDPVSPIGAHSFDSFNASPCSCDSITTTRANSTVIAYMSIVGASQTFNLTASWTQRQANTASASLATQWADKAITSPSATGTIEDSFSGTHQWQSATVEIKSPSANASGTIVQSLSRVTQAAAGLEKFTGTAAQTLRRVTQAAAGLEKFTGTAAQTLHRVTQAASGATNVYGSVTQSLGRLTQVATGGEIFTGTITMTLGRVTQLAVDVEEFTATVAQTLGRVTQAAVAKQVFSLVGVQTLNGVVQAALGTVTAAVPTARIVQTLGRVTQDVEGNVTVFYVGAIAQTLGRVTQHAEVFVPTAGVAAMTLRALTQQAAGLEIFTGHIVQMLPRVRQLATSVPPHRGSFYSWRG